jgi:hypothetical protein
LAGQSDRRRGWLGIEHNTFERGTMKKLKAFGLIAVLLVGSLSQVGCGNTQTLGSIGADFANVTINKTAGQRINLVGDVIMNGNFTLSQGTFTTQGYDLTIASNVTQANGTVYWTTSTVSVGGTLNRSGGSFYADASTFTFSGSSTQTINSGNPGFFNVVIDKTGGNATLAGALDVAGSLSVTNGILDTTNSNYPITISNHIFINNNTFNTNNSSINVSRN